MTYRLSNRPRYRDTDTASRPSYRDLRHLLRTNIQTPTLSLTNQDTDLRIRDLLHIKQTKIQRPTAPLTDQGIQTTIYRPKMYIIQSPIHRATVHCLSQMHGTVLPSTWGKWYCRSIHLQCFDIRQRIWSEHKLSGVYSSWASHQSSAVLILNERYGDTLSHLGEILSNK